MSRNRRLLAVVALAALVFLSGCSVFGGGEIDEDDLVGEQEYDWETNATASYDLSVSSSAYTAVLTVRNESSLTIRQSTAFQGDQPISVESLQFRFENGTVVNATHPGLTATEGSSSTEFGLPASDGAVAFTAPRTGKEWSTEVFVDGSHEVHLPESTRVGIPFLSRTSPSPDRETVEDDQMTLFWEDPGSSISLQYYLVRDLYIFGSILGLSLIIGVVGIVHYVRQIRQARQKREDVGLDIDYDDDEFGGGGPPPGMR